jgi:hypothetical protein
LESGLKAGLFVMLLQQLPCPGSIAGVVLSVAACQLLGASGEQQAVFCQTKQL